MQRGQWKGIGLVALALAGSARAAGSPAQAQGPDPLLLKPGPPLAGGVLSERVLEELRRPLLEGPLDSTRPLAHEELAPSAPEAQLEEPRPARTDLNPSVLATPPRRPDVRPQAAGVAAAETLAIHLTMLAWNRWVGEASWGNISGRSVWRNVTSSWVLDDDQYWINQLGHPYQGTLAYSTARSAGLSFWWSSLYPFAESTLWELTGETEPPSINDQVTTVVSGVVIGEVLQRISDALGARQGAGERLAAVALNPVGAVNSQIFARNPIPPPPARALFVAGVLTGDADGAGWASQGALPVGYAGLDLVYGIPGDPRFRLSRPFDHFVLQAGWGALGAPDATLRARGLVVGAQGELGRDARGVWGLFLSFDFDTPGDYRVSTSALGLGASGRLDLGPELALDGTAIASAVLMGAAGAIERPPPPEEGRDYRLGPGEQALLELDLLWRRVRAGVTLRQFFLYGLDQGAGTELRIDAGARAVFQLVGSHGVGVEAVRLLRRSEDRGAGPETESGSTVRVYYAYDMR